MWDMQNFAILYSIEVALVSYLLKKKIKNINLDNLLKEAHFAYFISNTYFKLTMYNIIHWMKLANIVYCSLNQQVQF